MAKWIATDTSGFRVEIEADTAREAAEEYVDGGEWGNITETTWVNVHVWPAGEEDPITEYHKITIEPSEPKCVDGEEHDWRSPVEIVGGIKESPGVYGHGGGVTIQEVCMRCGCGKLTDTWAHDPDDGSQGHTSVSYEPGKYEIEQDDEQ